MKTLERYVFGAFLSSFTLAFLVLSFVMTIGLLVQIVGLIMDGVPASLVGEFALVGFPETLQWTMPLALLVSSVLVFSRMSADSEVAAMRACGVNLYAVVRLPLAFGLVCTLLGCFVNNEIVPRGHEVRRTLKNRVSVDTGLDLLEPGRRIDDFPKALIYFERREGNWLYDLIVMDHSDPRVNRMIKAAKALVTARGTDVEFELYEMTVDPVDAEHRTMAQAHRFSYVVRDAIKDRHYRRRTKDFRFGELWAKIGERQGDLAKVAQHGERAAEFAERLRQEISELKLELSKRLVFAFASIAFILLGIPLGVKSQRKESSVGMAISLAVSLGYYLVIILMLSMEKYYAIHPELLIWLPVAACLGASVKLMRRHL